MDGLKWLQMSLSCCVLAIMLVAGVYMAKRNGLIPEDLRGVHQVSCWSLSHPELAKVGKDYALKSYAFVSCVVIDTRTGKVAGEFIPTIPGMPK